ncbi:MAG: hypothetical protein IT193_06100 [Propionibacteriaceae bacterium]|nr:hypothetical protein [Propionibacteriaceae bacterium]
MDIGRTWPVPGEKERGISLLGAAKAAVGLHEGRPPACGPSSWSWQQADICDADTAVEARGDHIGEEIVDVGGDLDGCDPFEEVPPLDRPILPDNRLVETEGPGELWDSNVAEEVEFEVLGVFRRLHMDPFDPAVTLENTERPANVLQRLVREPAEVAGVDEREPCDPEEDRGFQIVGVEVLGHGVLPSLVQPTMPRRRPRFIQDSGPNGPKDPRLVQNPSKIGPRADGPASWRPIAPGWLVRVAKVLSL